VNAKWLALTMAGEQFVIAGAYAYQRDFRHAAYWFFGACLILSVTL
jgi:hypothetical protein